MMTGWTLNNTFLDYLSKLYNFSSSHILISHLNIFLLQYFLNPVPRLVVRLAYVNDHNFMGLLGDKLVKN